MFHNQLYIDINGEFYLSLYPAFNEKENEEMVVYYKLNERDKVLVMSARDFLNLYKFHDPFPQII